MHFECILDRVLLIELFQRIVGLGTLVDGGLAHRAAAAAPFATIATTPLPIGLPFGSTPALSPLGIVAMVILIEAAGGYLLRNRFA